MDIIEKLEVALQSVEVDGEETVSFHSQEIVHLLALVKADELYHKTLNEGMDVLFSKAEKENKEIK